MTQVTRTTNELIINSLYLLGELGVGETPDAYMLSSGLELINELLGKFSSDSIYIPYLTTISFTMVPGQAAYTVSNLVTADVIGNRIVDLSFANPQWTACCIGGFKRPPGSSQSQFTSPTSRARRRETFEKHFL